MLAAVLTATAKCAMPGGEWSLLPAPAVKPAAEAAPQLHSVQHSSSGVRHHCCCSSSSRAVQCATRLLPRQLLKQCHPVLCVMAYAVPWVSCPSLLPMISNQCRVGVHPLSRIGCVDGCIQVSKCIVSHATQNAQKTTSHKVLENPRPQACS